MGRFGGGISYVVTWKFRRVAITHIPNLPSRVNIARPGVPFVYRNQHRRHALARASGLEIPYRPLRLSTLDMRRIGVLIIRRFYFSVWKNKIRTNTFGHVPADRELKTNVLLAWQRARREYAIKSIFATSGGSAKSRKAETSGYNQVDREIYTSLLVRSLLFVSRCLDVIDGLFFGDGYVLLRNWLSLLARENT